MAELIRVDDVEPQLWRNKGGYTRELLAWPSAQDCDLRIAVADITADGPFSSYEGVDRWITVISGVGIELTFNDERRELKCGDAPLLFDGAAAPDCRMLDGPTRDLNLMVRGGLGVMRAVQSGVAWTDAYAMRGVFAAQPGLWQDEIVACEVPSMALLWSTEGYDGLAWTFDYDAPQTVTQAWWLGFTPLG